MKNPTLIGEDVLAEYARKHGIQLREDTGAEPSEPKTAMLVQDGRFVDDIPSLTQRVEDEIPPGQVPIQDANGNVVGHGPDSAYLRMLGYPI